MNHDLVELFLQSAARTPDTVAIDVDGRHVTYARLAERVHGLGGALSGHVRPGDAVLLVVDRPDDAVVAMLACLYVGAAFVPVEPTTPVQRRASIVGRVAPTAVLHGAAQAEAVAGWGLPVPRVEVHASRPEPARHAPGPDDRAYVVFTSGSTGVPKGIEGRLKAIAHFCAWEADTFGIGPGDRVSALTTPMFDAFLRDAFTPLLHGATMVAPASRAEVLAPDRLAAWVEAARVSVLPLARVPQP